MRVWLDMANSPHPMLLGPVATDLEARGHELVVTTRDHGQTLALTRSRWPDALLVGGESPSGRVAKAAAILRRVRELRRVVGGAEVAISLNSYAQTVAARLERIPSVTLMDYEYQPANHVSFRAASRVVVPAAFPDERLRVYGARRVSRFAGFKEELYLDRVGRAAQDRDDRVLAVFRAPAEGSLYHRDINEAFDALIRQAAAREDVDALVLPRLVRQRERYSTIPGVRVSDGVVDGLATLAEADLFIGAGGTMSREAALLGIPAYTMFAGRLPAVDRELMRAGLLRDLRSAASVEWRQRKAGEAEAGLQSRVRRAAALRTWFVELIERVAAGGRPDDYA